MLQSFQPLNLAAHHSTARDHIVDCNITVGTPVLFTMHLHSTMEPTPYALRITEVTGISQLDCSTVVSHMAMCCTAVFNTNQAGPFALLHTVLFVIAQHFIQPKSGVNQNDFPHMVALDSNVRLVHPLYAIDNGSDSLPPTASTNGCVRLVLERNNNHVTQRRGEKAPRDCPYSPHSVCMLQHNVAKQFLYCHLVRCGLGLVSTIFPMFQDIHCI